MSEKRQDNVTKFPGTRPSTDMAIPEYAERIKFIGAMNPNNKDAEIILSAEPTLMRRIAGAGLHDKLFDYSYLVCGIPPQVNNIGYHERRSVEVSFTSTLIAPSTIFRGLERPYIDEGLDSNIYIYVSNPPYRYKYIPDMVCAAKRVVAPKNAVFVVYVKLSENDSEKGAIIGWEWVKADPDKNGLPADYKHRYENEVWSNG